MNGHGTAVGVGGDHFVFCKSIGSNIQLRSDTNNGGNTAIVILDSCIVRSSKVVCNDDHDSKSKQNKCQLLPEALRDS